jgi:DNA-binding response OmpR family regulator
MQQRIVVVDDDPIGAKVLRFVLDDEGYSTVTVSRGSLVFSEVIGRETDLVILDIGLPDIDGFSLCKELRARYYNGPVIPRVEGNRLSDRRGRLHRQAI